jgi:hypothetical protein
MFTVKINEIERSYISKIVEKFFERSKMETKTKLKDT